MHRTGGWGIRKSARDRGERKAISKKMPPACRPGSIDLRLTRSVFNQNSPDLTTAITGHLDTFLADSEITPASIEAVSLTGGTSLIHKLRQEFITRFGQKKIRDGQEFTSVADGLALSAPLFFPDLHR